MEQNIYSTYFVVKTGCCMVQGEEPVVVYMRREMVGLEELRTTTLRTLGLTQGKGLLRCYL